MNIDDFRTYLIICKFLKSDISNALYIKLNTFFYPDIIHLNTLYDGFRLTSDGLLVDIDLYNLYSYEITEHIKLFFNFKYNLDVRVMYALKHYI